MNDSSLQHIIDALRGADFKAYVKNVKAEIDEIFTMLQKNSKYQLDRCRLVGGLGKKTSVARYADADLVVFYNNKGCAKEDILNDFKNILVKHKRIRREDIKITPNFIMKFKLNDIPIELVIAYNHAVGIPIPTTKTVIDVQRERSYEAFKRSALARSGGLHGESVPELGMELTESSVDVIKKQSKFVHDVIILAKYWSQKLLFKYYVYGRSFIIETLAARAAWYEEKNTKPSLKQAFEAFLEMVSKIRTQRIIWNYPTYYNDSEIPAYIRSGQLPILMDPVNPYNNLLDGSRIHGLQHLFHVYEYAADAVLKLIRTGCKEISFIFSSQPGKYANFCHTHCDKCGRHDHRIERCIVK